MWGTVLFHRATFALTILLAGLLCRPALAQDAAKFDPATTTVAVLPCIDRTGEKEKDWRDRQAAGGYRNLVELFAERGFIIADRAAVTKAIADTGVDLNDEEEYRRENFIKIGKALNADIVVFTYVMATSEDRKSQGFFSLKDREIQGRATVKTWVVDVKNEKKILSADVREGKAAGASKLFGNNEGRWRRVNAIGGALKEQLTETVFKPYPKVKTVKVNEDGSLPK